METAESVVVSQSEPATSGFRGKLVDH